MLYLFADRVPLKARDAYGKDVAAGVLGAVMMGLTGPFVAIIARKTLHANAFEIGLLSMAPVAGNLFSLVWANVMEGRRKMPFAVWSWVAARALFFLCVFATTSASFVAIVAALNFIGSISAPAYAALIKEIYPDGDRARIMGYVRVCTVGAFVIVTAIAAPLLSGDHYRYLFPVAGLFGVASAFVFAKIHANEAAGDPSVSLGRFVHGGVKILRDDPGFRWFCGGIFVFGFANFLAMPIYTIYQVQIGVDTTWAGIYSIASALVMTVAYLYWGSYIDRKRPEGVVALQALVWASIPLIYCFATRPWMLLPTAVIGGVLGAGVELSYLTGVLWFAPSERITSYQAVFLSLMGLRGMVAPFVGAALNQSGLLSARSVFLLSAGMIMAGVVIQLVGMRRYGRFAGPGQAKPECGEGQSA